MVLVPFIYLAVAVAWGSLPFFAIGRTRFVTALLLGHIAAVALAGLYSVAFISTDIALLVLFCGAPGTALSVLFVFLRVAFPDKEDGPR